ncbi:PREDICTED: uncharacterized protein LOC106818328 [Priapulus caudatus]|uniref:Uncharacterized protein LOC106818328 n=1 Tax=Priapulus caudatus TaxID=37621 RepID=A0ABM1F259_PRICU|nr:PREDICTED: uncharacterized protein LOC106818328 [Priapulus caudatus]
MRDVTIYEHYQKKAKAHDSSCVAPKKAEVDPTMMLHCSDTTFQEAISTMDMKELVDTVAALQNEMLHEQANFNALNQRLQRLADDASRQEYREVSEALLRSQTRMSMLCARNMSCFAKQATRLQRQAPEYRWPPRSHREAPPAAYNAVTNDKVTSQPPSDKPHTNAAARSVAAATGSDDRFVRQSHLVVDQEPAISPGMYASKVPWIIKKPRANAADVRTDVVNQTKVTYRVVNPAVAAATTTTTTRPHLAPFTVKPNPSRAAAPIQNDVWRDAREADDDDDKRTSRTNGESIEIVALEKPEMARRRDEVKPETTRRRHEVKPETARRRDEVKPEMARSRDAAGQNGRQGAPSAADEEQERFIPGSVSRFSALFENLNVDDGRAASRRHGNGPARAADDGDGCHATMRAAESHNNKVSQLSYPTESGYNSNDTVSPIPSDRHTDFDSPASAVLSDAGGGGDAREIIIGGEGEVPCSVIDEPGNNHELADGKFESMEVACEPEFKVFHVQHSPGVSAEEEEESEEEEEEEEPREKDSFVVKGILHLDREGADWPPEYRFDNDVGESCTDELYRAEVLPPRNVRSPPEYRDVDAGKVRPLEVVLEEEELSAAGERADAGGLKTIERQCMDELIDDAPRMKYWDPTTLLRELYRIEPPPQEGASVASEEETPTYIPMEGYMEKLPLGKKKSTFWKSWKRRFFRARDGYLYYYEGGNREQASGCMKLAGGAVEDMGTDMLGIDDGRGRFLVVKTLSAKDKHLWKLSLSSQVVENRQALYVQPSLTFTPHPNKQVIIVDLGSSSVRAGILGSKRKLSLPASNYPLVECNPQRNQVNFQGKLAPHGNDNDCGGKVVAKVEQGSLCFVKRGHKVPRPQTGVFYYSSYIDNCIKEGQLLSLNKYSIRNEDYLDDEQVRDEDVDPSPDVNSSPHRYHAAYVGACVFAGRSEFDDSCISADDWRASPELCLDKWNP